MTPILDAETTRAMLQRAYVPPPPTPIIKRREPRPDTRKRTRKERAVPKVECPADCMYEEIGRNVVDALRTGGRIVLEIARTEHGVEDATPMISVHRSIRVAVLDNTTPFMLACETLAEMSRELRYRMNKQRLSDAQRTKLK